MHPHTIVYVTLGEPWAITPLYLPGLVAMRLQTIVYVMFGELQALRPLHV